METTPQLIAAVAEQGAAITDLTAALGLYRQAGASLEGVGFAFDSDEGPADRYVRASESLGEILVAACEADPNDGDAFARLIAAVTIDAKMVEQAALLAMMVEPLDPSGTATLSALTEEQVADLGDSLTEVAGPLLDEVEQGGPADSGAPGPRPQAGGQGDDRTIEPLVMAILERAGSDMVGTATACLPFAHQVVAHLAGDIVTTAPTWLGQVLDGLRRGFHALRRLVLRGWQCIMGKLRLTSSQARDVGDMLADEGHEFFHHLIDEGAARVLGRVLNGQWVIDTGQKTLRRASESDALKAIRACGPVVEHEKSRRRYIPYLNKSLPLLSALHAPGLVAGAAAAAVLLIYSAWNAHDHIDSPRLKVRLPGNPGLLQAIRDTLGYLA